VAKGKGRKSSSKETVAERPTLTVVGSNRAETGIVAAFPASKRQAGQRLWDMPYSSAAPRMINPSIGLHNLVARAGHNAGYDIDLTLLDGPDHRLIRSGVLLAHRVLDGRGEWYLGAPDWVPLLPKERIDPMSHGDLPEELADLIRPFRRRATLGPVAALRCERREFALRDDRGTTMALLRDDKVTVRRGGLTTARYREVMVTPVGPGLTEEQDFWLCQVLGQAGATAMDKFPRLVTRLGAPSNGLTDFPLAAPLDASAPFGTFVATLLSTRLRELLEADLAVRIDNPTGPAAVGEAAAQLRREIRGLAPVLEPDWIEDLDEELDWVVSQADQEVLRREGAYDGSAPGTLKARLRGERYLALLDRLVAARRVPRAGDASGRPTAEVLESLLSVGGRRLTKTADRLGVESAQPAWEATRSALDDLLRICDVVEVLSPGRFDRLRDRLDVVSQLLAESGRQSHLAQLTKELVVDASPEQAFELGRRYEHELVEANAAREAFVRHWSKTSKKLVALLAAGDDDAR
jgi:hypothetical protein